MSALSIVSARPTPTASTRGGGVTTTDSTARAGGRGVNTTGSAARPGIGIIAAKAAPPTIAAAARIRPVPHNALIVFDFPTRFAARADGTHRPQRRDADHPNMEQ